MPQRPLSEQRFNAIVQRVIASAPDGLSEAEFDALVDQEVANEEANQPHSDQRFVGPFAMPSGDTSRGLRETLPAVGGMLGGLAGNIPGAIAGGAAGALGRDLLRANAGDPETPRTAGEAATSVGLEGGIQGALTGIGNVVGRGVAAGGKWVAEQADPMIRAGLKVPIALMRRAAGASQTGVDAQVRRLVNVAKRERLTTPDAAEATIKEVERQIQDKIDEVGPNAQTVTRLTDAPTRSLRYLGELEKRAGRQMSPGSDPGTIAAERTAFQEGSPLFQTKNVVKRVGGQVVPDAASRDPNRTVTTLALSPVHQPRANVTVGETLELARGTSRHQTRKSYGELKGMSTEAQKALDRAGRDAAKHAAPELMPMLKREGELLKLKAALDAMTVRQGSRDVMSLPGVAGAAPDIAQGRLPILGGIARSFRNNQLPLGYTADRVGPALMRSGRPAGASVESLLRLLMQGQNPTEPPE